MKISICELKASIIHANLVNGSLKPKWRKQIESLTVYLREKALNGEKIRLSELLELANEVVPYGGWKA